MPYQPHLEELAPEHEPAFVAFTEILRAGDPAWFARFYGDARVRWTSAYFKAYVKKAEADRLDWRPKAGKVSLSRYVMRSEQGEILATAWLRFPLDKLSEIDGGNLVCDVAPSLRRRGYGSLCLSLLLFEAVRAGLRRALVTCAADDIGAKRVIELNRGVFLDIVSSTDPIAEGRPTARYWISFSS